MSDYDYEGFIVTDGDIGAVWVLAAAVVSCLLVGGLVPDDGSAAGNAAVASRCEAPRDAAVPVTGAGALGPHARDARRSGPARGCPRAAAGGRAGDCAPCAMSAQQARRASIASAPHETFADKGRFDPERIASVYDTRQE